MAKSYKLQQFKATRNICSAVMITAILSMVLLFRWKLQCKGSFLLLIMNI
uniref:Uncharacterized protein n=2 Tax=Anguilla anguilla TaxID=7936 RepID=A0A0E9QSA8_ANGAN